MNLRPTWALALEKSFSNPSVSTTVVGLEAREVRRKLFSFQLRWESLQKVTYALVVELFLL